MSDLRNKIHYSIIIPTLVDDPPILEYLLPIREFTTGSEIIVVKDRWGNASRTRNIGAAVAKGRILCFIDDDCKCEWKSLIDLLENFSKENEKYFIWHDPPHFLIIQKEDFIKVKGYDERFKPTMAETIELRFKLLKEGLKEISFDPSQISLFHLSSSKMNKQRYLTNQKHLTWVYLEYKIFPIWKLILRKNVFEVFRRIKWILEWILVVKRKKRSIFCP